MASSSDSFLIGFTMYVSVSPGVGFESFDFPNNLIFAITVSLVITSIYTDLLRLIKKMRTAIYKIKWFWILFWLSLWCVPRYWYNFTLSVMFVGMLTLKILLFCIHPHLRGINKWRVDRETMRGRGVLSNRIDKDKLKPGDHIYSWRKGWIYAHHGVYGKDGKVIHLTRGGGQKFDTGTALDPSPSHSKDNPMNPCPTCGCQLNQGGVRVISSCLECFLSGGNLYLYHYDVSVVFFLAKLRAGTCTLAPSDPPEKVLGRAEFLLSKDRNTKIRNGFVDYDLFHNNCEDFAIYCKTGPRVYFDIYPNYFNVSHTMRVRSSGQAGCLLATAIAVMGFLILGFPGATMGFVSYCLERIYSDVRSRLEWDKQVLRERSLFLPRFRRTWRLRLR